MPMSDDGNEYDNYQDELDNDNYREDDSNSSDGGGYDEPSKTFVEVSRTTKNKIIEDDMNVDEDDKLEEIEDSDDYEEEGEEDSGDDSEDSFEFTETIQ